MSLPHIVIATTRGTRPLAQTASPKYTPRYARWRTLRRGYRAAPPACLPVVDVGRRAGDFFDQRSGGIGADMRLKAVQPWPARVFYTARIAFSGRSDGHGINQRAALDLDRISIVFRGDRLK